MENEPANGRFMLSTQGSVSGAHDGTLIGFSLRSFAPSSPLTSKVHSPLQHRPPAMKEREGECASSDRRLKRSRAITRLYDRPVGFATLLRSVACWFPSRGQSTPRKCTASATSPVEKTEVSMQSLKYSNSTLTPRKMLIYWFQSVFPQFAQ
jgi:hypothetical protein